MQRNITLNQAAVTSQNHVKRRKTRARQHVQKHLQPAVPARQTGGLDILAACALPVTLPIRAGWWLLCHPYETTLLACVGVGGWLLSGVIL